MRSARHLPFGGEEKITGVPPSVHRSGRAPQRSGGIAVAAGIITSLITKIRAEAPGLPPSLVAIAGRW